MSAEQTPDIETVLAEHRPVIGRFAALNVVVGCSCMDRVFVARSENYAAHVAQALAPVLAAAVREAEQRALREAADAIQALHPGETKNSVTFLRDRADRVAEPQHEAATSARVLLTQPHDGHDANETCPGCPHEAATSGKESEASDE